MAAKAPEPRAFTFADDGSVPNNRLPLLVYRGGVSLSGTADPEAAIEKVFKQNGWGHGMWRNGIFPYVHYHSMIHETMGIARGRAKVRFGGNKGEEIDLTPGDVAVLPAGIGHQRLWASPELVVIGAYPPEGKYDLCRGGKREHMLALETIPKVPVPKSDPVGGEGGALTRLWSR